MDQKTQAPPPPPTQSTIEYAGDVESGVGEEEQPMLYECCTNQCCTNVRERMLWTTSLPSFFTFLRMGEMTVPIAKGPQSHQKFERLSENYQSTTHAELLEENNYDFLLEG